MQAAFNEEEAMELDNEPYNTSLPHPRREEW